MTFELLLNDNINIENVKTFTMEEVARHRTIDDMWMVIDGLVYDFTNWNLHPVGNKILLKVAGTDATKAYRKSHSKIKISDEIQEKYLIGYISN